MIKCKCNVNVHFRFSMFNHLLLALNLRLPAVHFHYIGYIGNRSIQGEELYKSAMADQWSGYGCLLNMASK